MAKRNYNRLNATLIYQLKKKINELKASEEKFRSIFEKSADGIAIADIKTKKFSDVNNAFCKLTSYSKNELLKKTILEIHPKKDLPYILNEFKLQSEGKKTLAENISIKKKNGNIIYTEVNSMTIFINNKPYLLGIFRDSTERRQAEEKLKQSEEKFHDLVENTSDWVWEVDNKGKYTYSNSRVKNILGYKPKEIIGKTPFDLMLPEEAKKITSEFTAIIKSKKQFDALENANLHKNGQTIILETSGVPVFDANGKFAGYNGIDRDITERKKIEEELKQSEENYKNMFENVNYLIQSVDINGKFSYVNKKWKKTLGYTTKDLKKLKLTDILRKDQRINCTKLFKKVVSGNKLEHIKIVFITKKGKEIPVVGNASSWYKDGKFSSTISIFRDITKFKKTEEKLNSRIKQLEKTNKLLKKYKPKKKK